MRTKIEATWIVGYARGHHALLRDAELVFEGNRIAHVGKGFEGHVDQVIDAKGKLVSPGSSTPTCIPATAPRTD